MSYTIVQKTEGTLEVTCKTATGALVDFTGASAVVFRMMDGAGTNIIDDVAGAFDADRTSGKISYVFTIPNTDRAAGDYFGRFRVTHADGHVESYPRPGVETIIIVQEVTDG